jgi:putative inorganic carbon (HCO3(-)) transporter
MLLIFLIIIFILPFISSLAFPYLNTVYSVTLAIFLGAYVFYEKPSFPKTKIIIHPIILFFLVFFVSGLFSQNKLNSLSEVNNYIAGVLLFFVAASLSERGKTLVMETIILSGLVISFLAIYQYFFGFKHVLDYLSNNGFSSPFVLDWLQRKRAFLPFVTPNALGGYLALVLPLVLVNKTWFILPIFFALLLTKSLGALFALFCASVIYFFLQDKLKKINILFLAGLLVLIAVIFILRSVTPNQHTLPVFSSIMRLNYWQGTWEIIKAYPFLGVGPGNFNLMMSRYAHNSYLQIWAEMGILGLISFIWIIAGIFKVCFRSLKNSFHKVRITVLLTASAVFLIHNFFDFTFFLPETVYIWWIILGLAVDMENKPV